MALNKKSIDSSFDDFLAEEVLLKGATATAFKRVSAWQIEQEMKARNINH